MPNDLIERPDWGPAPSGFGGRLTPGTLDAALSTAASTIAGGAIEARQAVESLGLPRLEEEWTANQEVLLARVGHAREAIAAVDALPSQDRQFVITSFDGLSSPCRMAVMTELGMGKPGGAARASAAELADFEGLLTRPEVAGLKNRWRGRYERNVKRVLTRLRNIYGRLGSNYHAELDSWYERLRTPQVISIAAALAGE